MEHTMMIAEPVINWCWFTELTMHEDQTVTIHLRDRLHYGRHINHPKPTHDLPLRFLESKDGHRTAVAVRIGDTQYPIRNQKHIFSYGKFDLASGKYGRKW